MKETYEQFLPIEKIREILDDNFLQHHGKEGSSFGTTTVPFITIGKFGFFSIRVRLAKFGNNAPGYDGVAQGPGSHRGVIGKDLEDTIRLAVQEAHDWYARFYQKKRDVK